MLEPTELSYPLVTSGLPLISASRNKTQENSATCPIPPWVSLLRAKHRFLHPLSGKSTQMVPHWAQNKLCLVLQAKVGEGNGSRAPQSLPEMQLGRQLRLHTQAALPAGGRRGVKRVQPWERMVSGPQI